MDKVIKLSEDGGLGDEERPNLEVTQRAMKATTKKMAETGVKKGMRSSELQSQTGQCLIILYTFGPEGSWIKGLVAEKP